MAHVAFGVTVGQQLGPEAINLQPISAGNLANSASALAVTSGQLTADVATVAADLTGIQTAANAIYVLTGFSALTGATAAETALNIAITLAGTNNTTVGTDAASIAASSTAITALESDVYVSIDLTKISTITNLKRVFDNILRQAAGNGSLTA